MEHRILLIDDLVALLRLSRSTIDRRTREARDGKIDFPIPISASGQRMLWDINTVEQWLASRNRDSPLVNTLATKSEKQKARDFAERQQRAQQALDRHRSGRSQQR